MTLQTVVDARETLNIRAYEVWSGWQQEHALAELERRLEVQSERSEAAIGSSQRGGQTASAMTSACLSAPREWPVFWMAVAALAVGALLGLKFW